MLLRNSNEQGELMLKSIGLTLILFSSFAFADTYVRGHFKKNGTYVNGYHRTSPNKTKSDNYSTYGNTNPYTGKPGSKRQYGVKAGSSIYNSNSGY